MECVFCKESFDKPGNLVSQSIQYMNLRICDQCCLNLLEPIYTANFCGGLVHYAFKDLISSTFNRKRRRSLKYKKNLFRMLLFKYKFKCVKCGEKEESKLTIDHIHPYSKGGPDDYSNLQILCKSCNSKKGTKANEKFLNITEDKC